MDVKANAFGGAAEERIHSKEAILSHRQWSTGSLDASNDRRRVLQSRLAGSPNVQAHPLSRLKVSQPLIDTLRHLFDYTWDRRGEGVCARLGQSRRCRGVADLHGLAEDVARVAGCFDGKLCL